MSQIAGKPRCLTPIPVEVWQRLRGVLDPELDDSILELGFVEALQFEGGHLTVKLRLPTTWCSPNFVYMMTEDVRVVLLTVESVRQVSVLLKDHFAAEGIEAAVNAGKSFKDAFPDEAFGDLDELRLYFLQKEFSKTSGRSVAKSASSRLVIWGNCIAARQRPRDPGRSVPNPARRRSSVSSRLGRGGRPIPAALSTARS